MRFEHAFEPHRLDSKMLEFLDIIAAVAQRGISMSYQRQSFSMHSPCVH
jgi:hypothetical protein